GVLLVGHRHGRFLVRNAAAEHVAPNQRRDGRNHRYGHGGQECARIGSGRIGLEMWRVVVEFAHGVACLLGCPDNSALAAPGRHLVRCNRCLEATPLTCRASKPLRTRCRMDPEEFLLQPPPGEATEYRKPVPRAENSSAFASVWLSGALKAGPDAPFSGFSMLLRAKANVTAGEPLRYKSLLALFPPDSIATAGWR